MPGLQGTCVPGLIEPELVSSRQLQAGGDAPTLVRDGRRYFDAFGLQRFDGGVNVVAHQVEFVPAGFLDWVNREFGGRQGEYEPAASRIYGWEFEDVAKQIPDAFRLTAVQENVNSVDHLLGYLR